MSDCLWAASHSCSDWCHSVALMGRPAGKEALSWSSAAGTQPSGMVLPISRTAFMIGFVVVCSRRYSLIFRDTICELHVCQPSSRHGEGQGLVLLCPRICLAAIRCALSMALLCVVVRVVAAKPQPAAFST